jgi:hypothetical protein
MAFHVTHRYGAMDSDPPLSSLPALLRELDDRPEDTEHSSVALSHESEWCIAVMRGGYVIFEHLESDAGGARAEIGVTCGDRGQAAFLDRRSGISQGGKMGGRGKS